MTDLSGQVLSVELPPATREFLLRMTMGNVTLARQLAERAVLRGANWLFLRIQSEYCRDQAAGIRMAGQVASDAYDRDPDRFADNLSRVIAEANEPPF